MILWRPRFKDFCRASVWPVVYIVVTMIMLWPLEGGGEPASWFSAGVMAAIAPVVIVLSMRPQPQKRSWRPAEFTEHVDDLVMGDSFYLRPAPSTGKPTPDHVFIAGGLGKDGRRVAISLETGNAYLLEEDREVRRVQVQISVSSR